jgi:hypothetical protein
MKFVVAGVVFLIVGFFFVLNDIPVGVEPLTEVYFEDHLEIPAQVRSNDIQEFSFVVRNLEYRDVRYYYNVGVFGENGELLKSIDAGSVELEHDESLSLDERYFLDEGFDRAKVEVRLEKEFLGDVEVDGKYWWADSNYPKEISIHFWFDEHSNV